MNEDTREGSCTATASPITQRGKVEAIIEAPERAGAARYELRGEHARGGLGRISRALDHNLGREVAIKQLLAGGIRSEVRFVREARITARLEHPGIVPVYEAGRWSDGTPFFAMKLVAGRPLRALIVERATVAERIALLHHVIAVADAMAYAHDRGVIHRDLKPGNVIAGDFGETIVIDWGLAKELGDDEQSGQGARGSSNDLTQTGSVMGTPAYMAPEQARGEPVDQRADVYAIGMMLWELCALERTVEGAERRRVLRRNGVDPDLITILDKALQDDPAQRYPDAGALAADLKAFKAGARIAARSYSLPAMLGHWARRRRALTLAIAGAAVVAIALGTLYLHGLASAHARVEVERDRQLLEHAELLLQTDPSAAAERLAAYRGQDTARAARLAAESVGLGVAKLRAQPHTKSVSFAAALADGTIATTSLDGTIAKTTRDGATRVIARGVAQWTYAYAPRRHLLAYACNATGLCLIDVATERAIAPPSDRPAMPPTCMELSPSENLLATITPRGDVSVWHLADDGAATRVYSARRASGSHIQFVDEHTLAVEDAEDLEIVHLPAPGIAPREPLRVEGVSHTHTNAARHLAAASNDAGELFVIDTERHATTRSAPVCKGFVNFVSILRQRAALAYACQDGDAGVYDLESRRATVLAHLDGGAIGVGESEDGRYLVTGGVDGSVAIYDFATELVSMRRGHADRITVLQPPTAAFPYLITADTAGALRTWTMPGDELRVVARTTSLMLAAVPLANGGPVVALSVDATLPWRARDGRTGALADHAAGHILLASSPRRPELAMFGTDDTIEWWSLEADAARRTLQSRRGAIAAGAFLGDGALLTGGRSGALERWRDGAATDVGDLGEAVSFVRPLPATNDAIIGGVDGALWRTRGDALERIAGEPQPITSAAISGDGRSLAIGTARGDVRRYDLATATWHDVASGASAVDQVELSPDGAQLLVIARGQLAIHATNAASRDALGPALPALRSAAFSPDGRWLVALGIHGGLWFHRAADDRWVYLATGIAKLVRGTFSDDSTQLVATDAGGRALVVDLTAPMFR